MKKEKEKGKEMEKEKSETPSEKIENVKYELEIIKDKYYEICDEISSEIREEMKLEIENKLKEMKLEKELKTIKDRFYKLGEAQGIIETIDRIKEIINK